MILLKSPHSSGNIDLPNGLKVKKSYHFLHFQLNFSPAQSFYYELSKMGELLLPNGYNIKVEYIDGETIIDDHCILLDASSISFPLIIRTRRDGDRIHLKGMVGRKKSEPYFYR